MADTFTLDDTLDAAHTDIASDLPEPQQHAIDEAQRQAASGAVEQGSENIELDALGVPWDPKLHATGKDGKGVRQKGSGAWRRRRGMGGSASSIGQKVGAQPTDPAQERAEIEAQSAETASRMAGAMMATLQIQLSVGIGGQHFLPRELRIPGAPVINERDMLAGAWGDYFIATGTVTPPAWAMLLGAMSMYYLPRFQEPEVRSRVGGIFGRAWHGCKAAYHWMRYRKPLPKEKVTEKDRQGATDAQQVG